MGIVHLLESCENGRYALNVFFTQRRLLLAIIVDFHLFRHCGYTKYNALPSISVQMSYDRQ